MERHLLLCLNPMVYVMAGEPVRVGDVVGDHGWDLAENQFPEIRDLLQRCREALENVTVPE